jgi:hypothetical protein
MTLEEANYLVRISIMYTVSGWEWCINTDTPFGFILGYKKYETPNEALEELKQFLRYFTKNVLKDGDSIRKYVEKHNPIKKNGD